MGSELASRRTYRVILYFARNDYLLRATGGGRLERREPETGDGRRAHNHRGNLEDSGTAMISRTPLAISTGVAARDQCGATGPPQESLFLAYAVFIYYKEFS